MFLDTKKKVQGIVKVKIDGITFEIKKVTPEDYTGQVGIPISKWQLEADKLFEKQRENKVTLAELKKLWKTLFTKAIVSINKRDPKEFIDDLLENFELCYKLYSEIVIHCNGGKKKLKINIFRKHS